MSDETKALHPAERIALTVARAQVARGEEPWPNVAAVCVAALARIMGDPIPDWVIDEPESVSSVSGVSS